MNLSMSPAAAGQAVKLDRLAETAVRVGLNLRKGQELVVTAPIEALDLARRVTEHAYRAGASLVTVLLSDDEQTLARYRHGRVLYAGDAAHLLPGDLHGARENRVGSQIDFAHPGPTEDGRTSDAENSLSGDGLSAVGAAAEPTMVGRIRCSGIARQFPDECSEAGRR